MKQEELSLIKNQMNDLFTAHRQMSGIYKNSTIRLLSRVIDNEVFLSEPVEVIFRGKTLSLSSVISEKDSFVKIRGSWECCSGSSCSFSDNEICVDLNSLNPDEVIEIASKILERL